MPLVEQAIKAGKIHPKAMGKSLGRMEADLEVLSSDKELSELQGDERAKAEALMDAAGEFFGLIT